MRPARALTQLLASADGTAFAALVPHVPHIPRALSLNLSRAQIKTCVDLGIEEARAFTLPASQEGLEAALVA